MDGVLWGACDPEPLQQVGLFGGAESQASVLSGHPESPYPQYWVSEPWRTDEIPDITLMSVDPYDAVLSLPGVTGETIHDFACAPSQCPQQGQWGHSESYPLQDAQEILNSQLLQFNSSKFPSPHVSQEFNTFKTFGTTTPVLQSRPVNISYRGPPTAPNSRPVGTTDAGQYGGLPSSIGMFASPRVPERIISPSGMGGGFNFNLGLLDHLPKLHHPVLHPTKTGGNVNGVEIPRTCTFISNQKGYTLPPLADVTSCRRDTVVVEEPKIASFNPGPYVNSARAPLPTQNHQEDVHGMWLDDADNNSGKCSAMPIPNSGHWQQQQHLQGISNSSVTNMGFKQRTMVNASPVMNLSYERRVMSKCSSETNLGCKSRHPKPLSDPSASVRMGAFEHRPKQTMSSSSPIPTIVGFEPTSQHGPIPSSFPVPIMDSQAHQPSISSSSLSPTGGFGRRRQQQPLKSTSPSANMGGVEPRQKLTLSASPPLSNLSFEPRQSPPPPVSSLPSSSNAVFEPRRQQAICITSTVSELARQQPSASNSRPDSDELAPKWPSLRTLGVPGSEKSPIMRQQPETGIIKCALPRNTCAKSSPAANANLFNKRPLRADDNKIGSMNKKPMQKWQGVAGCSRLEEISEAAHQKVTQSTNGRALGPALNTNLKPRARQGSANDPQSIAARVRRERISERLKVLQSLIPNGDKVDMVTMLEKAINYVQCLELQIRMLKNDSLWPKALGPLPNTLQELLELAGPEFCGGMDVEEALAEKPTTTKKPGVRI